ncbi:MAG: HAMP domain-containing protein [Lewinellaceae bacterium]|nr:HAMP domain-containing protein [Lewinellaceae bacterium]
MPDVIYLESIADAFRYVLSGQKTGNVVVTLSTPAHSTGKAPMKKRYYRSMLSLCLLVVVFDAVYFPAHKTLEMFLGLAAVHVMLFGVVNFFGARWLYGPVAQAFDRSMDTPQARQRIRNLNWYSAVWIFCLGVGYYGIMLLLVYFSPMDTGDIAMEKIPASMWLTAIPSILYVYALLPAFIAWFVVNDFTLDLKAKAFGQFGFVYPAGNRRIGPTLLVTFIILGFFPSVLVTLELIATHAGETYTQFSAMTPLEAILPDRIIVFIGMIFAVVYITRSFTKPIHALLGEINRVRDGDFSTQAAVITEDEIGVLTREFNGMVRGLHERELIRDTFGKYVTRDVADAILNKKVNVAGEVRQCTVLVTDIANYTGIAEDLTPQEVIEMLNEYFSEMVAIIQAHRGVVNKFIGDAVFAMFNVPLDDPDHAVHAIRAALEIRNISTTRSFGKNRRLSTRIGINTGVVVAGNIGSAERMEYTVIGDEVNVASRLEQLNKEYDTHILLGGNTYEMAKGHFEFDKLGTLQLKGKERAIEVYTVKQ